LQGFHLFETTALLIHALLPSCVGGSATVSQPPTPTDSAPVGDALSTPPAKRKFTALFNVAR
jgi:hypothetical protein